MVKKTYSQLLDEIEQLKRHAEEVRHHEVEEVIARIKAAIAFYGLTPEDLGFSRTDSRAATPPPPPPPPSAQPKKRKSRYTERPLAGPRY